MVKAQGRLSSERFHYNQARDVSICSAGELLFPQGRLEPRNGVQRNPLQPPGSSVSGLPAEGGVLTRLRSCTPH